MWLRVKIGMFSLCMNLKFYMHSSAVTCVLEIIFLIYKVISSFPELVDLQSSNTVLQIWKLEMTLYIRNSFTSVPNSELVVFENRYHLHSRGESTWFCMYVYTHIHIWQSIIWKNFVEMYRKIGPSQMVKNLPVNAGGSLYRDSIPGSGRSPRVGNGNPHQYSCLENPMDRGT